MAPRQTWSKFFPPVLTALAVVFLVFIWHRNYNLLGSLYDYSIIASAVGHMENGLTPYRSFSTPLQSLTLYLGYFCELIFGRRYLSLAYGNLVIGLAAFFVMLRLTKPVLPFPVRLVAATAYCACTFFQHGIIWVQPTGHDSPGLHLFPSRHPVPRRQHWPHWDGNVGLPPGFVQYDEN